MTAIDPLRRLDALLWFGVPKSGRSDTRGIYPSDMLSRDRVMLVSVSGDPDNPEFAERMRYCGARSGSDVQIPPSPQPFPDAQTVKVPIEHLRAVLDACTDDYVEIVASSDYPIRIRERCGSREIVAWIAPRISNE